MNEDDQLSVTSPGVLANDFEPEGSSLTARLIDDVENGTLTLNVDGGFEYTPAPNFFGSDGFSYRASDGDAESDETLVSIEVSPVNDPPTAVVDAYNLVEDQEIQVGAPGVLGNDSDLDGDNLVAAIQTTPSNGTLEFESDGSFTYTPNPDFSGLDGFTYGASDGQLTTIAAVTLTVAAANDPPVALDDSYNTPSHVELVVPASGVLSNDIDLDGDQLTARLAAEPLHGEVILNPNGSFSYQPDVSFTGRDSLKYIASDGTFDSDSATVVIDVTSIGNAPIAADDFYSAAVDQALLIEAPGVLLNDSDADQDLLTVSVETEVSAGSLTLNPDGAFSYTPEAGFTGVVTFTYRATDGQNVSNAALVQITYQ